MTKKFVLARSATMPNWTFDFLLAEGGDEVGDIVLRSEEDRMAFLVRMLQRQIEEKTGGPFTAGVFVEGTGELVGVGVNRVVPDGDPTAHAETRAIPFACHALGEGIFQLGMDPQGRRFELVTTGSPCGMCVGSIKWGGISTLVTGASALMTELETGFNEFVQPNWRAMLNAVGVIQITEGVLQDEVIAAYRRYRELDGVIYEGTRNEASA